MGIYHGGKYLLFGKLLPILDPNWRLVFSHLGLFVLKKKPFLENFLTKKKLFLNKNHFFKNFETQKQFHFSTKSPSLIFSHFRDFFEKKKNCLPNKNPLFQKKTLFEFLGRKNPFIKSCETQKLFHFSQ